MSEDDDSFIKTESQEVEVGIDSDLGKQFLRLWGEFLKEKRTFDSILPITDPKGFMRITVRLAWENDEVSYKKRLVLKEILEPGWYGESIQGDYWKTQNDAGKEGEGESE